MIDEPADAKADEHDEHPKGRFPPLYQTAAEAAGVPHPTTSPTPGLTMSPGLEKIEGSTAPALADGTAVSHVRGPQQAPVDPIAAGLDTGHNPATRNENRVISQTGQLASGPGPSTYAEKGQTPAPPPSDHSLLAPPPVAPAADAKPEPEPVKPPAEA